MKKKETKDKKIHRGGCLCCPQTEDILPMDTVLYWGFGGYKVYKNGKMFYMGKPDAKWESYKTLKKIEREAKKYPRSKWVVELNNPLRGAKWKRNSKGEWVLFETNQGFA